MSRSAAYRFINVHETLGGKRPEFGTLSREALFSLAAPSTDEAIREEVERRLAEGERVTAAQIEALRLGAAGSGRRLRVAATPPSDRRSLPDGHPCPNPAA